MFWALAMNDALWEKKRWKFFKKQLLLNQNFELSEESLVI